MPDFSDVQRWVIPAILLVAVAGIPLALWWEKRHPSSFTRRPRVVGSGPDEAALDAVERREQGRLRTQSEWRRWDPDAVADAAEAAADLAHRAQVNALFHP